VTAFNKVILIGNLTRDPELRATPKGTAVCQLGLAVNSTFRDKDGNDREEVTFVDVDAFGRQAETLAKYLTKGRPVLVEGRLKLDTWETKEGDKRSKLKVILDAFQFIGAPRKDGDS
jgi:single-strand DNA-binding protein